METKNETKKNYFQNIVIAQCICILIILLSTFVVKTFFTKQYEELKQWYQENICAQTDINEVLEIGGENNESKAVWN